MTTLQAPVAGIGPVTQTERIESLDVLRGFAVLGILVMNIQSFSMIGAAYKNPTAYGDLTGANYWVWLLGHVLVDMKFMGMFSMMFGAGIVLMASRREAATGRSAGVHYRRMGWLLLFGAMHAYLLWYGDILFTYAVCGALAYLFRRRRATTLIILGTVFVALASGISIFFHWSMQFWPPEAMQEPLKWWAPSKDVVAAEIAAYRGAWSQQLPVRAGTAILLQTFLLLFEFLWRAGGLMLVGMGLFKLGVFSTKRSTSAYLTMIAVGVLVGVPVILYGVRRNTALEWDLEACFYLGSQFNYWGSLAVSLGWVGLIMLLCKHGVGRPVTRLLAATGQMAFTNYILQTIICTTIFYGHGFGLFGKVERTGQIGTVFAVWIFLLIVSPLWLRHLRFGPLEWLWRSLTYMKLQPMARW